MRLALDCWDIYFPAVRATILKENYLLLLSAAHYLCSSYLLTIVAVTFLSPLPEASQSITARIFTSNFNNTHMFFLFIKVIEYIVNLHAGMSNRLFSVSRL